jgi:hypothetical protein
VAKVAIGLVLLPLVEAKETTASARTEVTRNGVGVSPEPLKMGRAMYRSVMALPGASQCSIAHENSPMEFQATSHDHACQRGMRLSILH